MACYLTGPTHNLNQCWLAINKGYITKITVTSPRDQFEKDKFHHYLLTCPFLNLFAPGRCGNDIKNVIFKLILQIDFMSSFCETTLRGMPQDFPDD